MKKFRQNEIKELLADLVNNEHRKHDNYHKNFRTKDIENHIERLFSLLSEIQDCNKVFFVPENEKDFYINVGKDRRWQIKNITA